MQICCSAYSVILNVTATQYTCHSMASTTPTEQFNEVVIAHACTFQSILLGCQDIDVTQTILIILTMACTCVCIFALCVHIYTYIYGDGRCVYVCVRICVHTYYIKFRGVQHFGISGPHWKNSRLGPHIKYIATYNHKKIL